MCVMWRLIMQNKQKKKCKKSSHGSHEWIYNKTSNASMCIACDLIVKGFIKD